MSHFCRRRGEVKKKGRPRGRGKEALTNTNGEDQTPKKTQNGHVESGGGKKNLCTAKVKEKATSVIKEIERC